MHEHTFYEVAVDGTVVRLHCNECGLSVDPDEFEDEYVGHEYIEGIGENTDAEDAAVLKADIAADNGPIFKDIDGA